MLATNEGGDVTLKLNIDDTENDAYEVAISWGDGSPNTVERFEGNGRDVQGFDEFIHTYDDDALLGLDAQRVLRERFASRAKAQEP